MATAGNTVYIVNLTIYTGTDFSQSFALEREATNSRLNLTGYNVCAKMRKAEESTTSIPFIASITNIAQGRVTVAMGATVTSALKPGKYLYDLLLQDSTGYVERVVEGSVNVKKTVTR